MNKKIIKNYCFLISLKAIEQTRYMKKNQNCVDEEFINSEEKQVSVKNGTELNISGIYLILFTKKKSVL